ncbi:cell division ATP-binding protein FtsE [Ammonifex degensii KC4]|uniref:Cell division ATP-binding protein FtsE n=1 Tax=Ammonifex degensii (strain DSM 10501 / KC4) TaxID=429009 RepID=C9RBJ5_AMMDK|nr:cell division ATP-binding protein FtsE [Ammonifex degensii]ACX51622.1 cell division ATP-binding protein FtsE [Ammonifex degensii KC4]
MIRFCNVTKIYPNGVRALIDVSFSIERGEFVFVVGPSGAGKTTLTKLICREELPTRGQVLVNGKNVARLRPNEVANLRQRIGMVFQDFRLLPRKTVFENVALALEIAGASWREIRKRVPEVLAKVGLEDKARCFPHQLSGGEQQRVAIARALVNRPFLLMADEPTGNLDPQTSWDLLQLLLKINEEGTTVLMVTHAWDLVQLVGKRVISLQEGRLTEELPAWGNYRYGT